MIGFELEHVAAALRAADLLVETVGALPERAADITDDSRTVQPGALFIAVRGSARDGHQYLPQAAQSGAVAAIVEDKERTTLPARVVRD
ncbi:MAG: UDP-N-acetylmuramoyl-tripeptide--D-alanyl-D-alanine ligase, partial [Gemmatimonadaceae bacterium]|nr:UDP-N-acetylmuramoyl-tripeptide--D-alanyl-D-alanine ligase [Gemmatimonadaceae bacterium]